MLDSQRLKKLTVWKQQARRLALDRQNPPFHRRRQALLQGKNRVHLILNLCPL
jgi:hypothetical protein